MRGWRRLTAVLAVLTSSQQLDTRLTELTLSTSALQRPTHVRVLLPAGYDQSQAERFPVLYLLHGAFADYRSWTDAGDATRHAIRSCLRGPAPSRGPWTSSTTCRSRR